MAFKSTIPLVFNPITAVGLIRAFDVLDRAVQRSGENTILDPNIYVAPAIYIPLACAIYSISAAVLAHRANIEFAEANPKASTTSTPALLAWVSAGCIALMCFVAVKFETIALWLLAYGVLCVVNAFWNIFAVSDNRAKHVAINAFMGVALIVLIAVKREFVLPNDSVLIHVVLIAIFVITLLKRTWPRSYGPVAVV